MESSKLLLSFLLLSTFKFFFVTCTKFEVGGTNGWEVPKNKNQQFYNQWASQNRFNVNDTVYFKYKKDSVMEVTEEEYGKCHSTHPLFFSNNGETVFKLDRPGFFFFISGVAGHCQRGQKMIIKVLEPEIANPPQAQNQKHNSSALGIMPTYSPTILLLMILSVFGAFSFQFSLII
ncbi:early nodulin-like protein 5 [Ziziphus jujuba]|uniref:Early nodulin-like protein 5 n=1 Tax=Ziziphus jujuba TaxID=326968 RepID=A0ABM4AHZ8_ZIZJJ|nr:early nodulin-like protein 5 [Ziziphus jujuba]